MIVLIFHLSAHELAKEQKLNFGLEVASLLRSARKKRFTLAEEKRIQEENELQKDLNDLLNAEKER